MKKSNKQLVSNTLSSRAFWQVNKAIARKVGHMAAILLAELIYRRDYWEEHNGLQEDGTFYKLAHELEAELGIGEEARVSAQKKLIAAGFLTIVRKGIPSKNFYKLDDDAIAKVLGEEEPSNPSEEKEKKPTKNATKELPPDLDSIVAKCSVQALPDFMSDLDPLFDFNLPSGGL